MSNLCSPREVQQLLTRFGLRPNKSLGQNFLVDANFLDKIVTAADVSQQDTVLEIGPGLGTLTRALAKKGANILAIEKDRHLQPLLAETLAGLPVRLIAQDALEVDYYELLSEIDRPKVVANLPYYVTTPLIVGLLRSRVDWANMVFLVQREVVDRIMAQPGKKAYGILSIVSQYYARPKLVAVVPPGAFYPPPQVASAVVQLLPRDLEAEGMQLPEPDDLFRIAKAALGQRRKTLLNALVAAMGLPRAELQQLISDLGWAPERRGETLSVQELVSLTNCLSGR